MMKRLLIGWFVLGALAGIGQAQEDLEKSFTAPPDSAKPHTWWHWMNGNITKEGITADLEAMQRVGINGAQIFNVDEGIPEGPVRFMSPEWFELFRYAASEAKRLGMELAFHNCAGWSASGGPWVTPEFAMQTVVSSEVQVKGPAQFDALLPMPEIKLGYYRDISVFAFPTPKGGGKVEGVSGKALSGTSGHGRQSSETGKPGEAVVMRGEMVDLSAKLGSDGKLNWEVPAGEWTILRTGHTPTGAINSPAPKSGRGLEVDKLSREAFDSYWAGGVGRMLKQLGPLAGGAVNQALIDSYEVGNCNWTPHFRAEFIKRRGYDPIPFLPVLSGRYVDGSEVTERFLWDFRRVIGDLYFDNYYGYFSELCQKNGLLACVEPYSGPYESLQAGAKADILMGEFWADPDRGESGSVKLAASLAHTHGLRFVGAESFTADQKRSKWLNHPGSLKAIGDLQWCGGVNRFVMHCYPHQPWVEQVPGMTMGRWGTNFSSKNTWWEQSRAWMAYIARGQSLLQQGLPVADVLFFGGEASPSGGIHRPDLKARGYDYDAVGTDLMSKLTVRDGCVVTPAGTSYRLLVLPNTTGMTPELARIVRELVRQGATVMGPKPAKSPGLSGFPGCDAEVQAIAGEVWGAGPGDHRFGKGRVVTGPDVEAVLKQLALAPDFAATGDGPPLSFIHRRIGAAEVYLVANRESQPRRVVCEFRVAGLQPELWDAETGDIADAACWKIENARTKVTLDLNQSASIFVVFRHPVKTSGSLVQSFTAPPPPAPFHTPVLRILSAHYGSLMVGPNLADVTEPLQRLVRDNRIEVIDYRDFAGDPAPGVMKNMRVTYTIGGKTRTANVTEHEILELPQEGDGPGELRIVQAVYGGALPDRVDARPNALADITARVAGEVRDNRIAVRIDQDLTGVEPAPGGGERLWIKYSVDGVEADQIFGTGNEIRLPEKPASFQPPAPTMAVTASGTVLRAWDAGRYAVKRGAEGDELVTEVEVPEPMAVTGPWEISFQAKRGAPEQAVFENLISWPDHPDDGIKYFSGTGTYRRTLEIPASLLGPGKELHLDLGRVKEIAEVRLNGQDLGILWKAPYRVNLGAAARAGKNTLEIEVTNLWPNRLIGDEQLPEDVEWNGLPLKRWPEWLQQGTPRPVPQRVTFTTWHHWRKDSTLLPSGLLGPVILRPLVVVPVASMALKAEFLDPPLKRRAKPLWFWNEAAVTPSGIEAQMQACRDQCGYGGLAPLPFGKNFTPKYLSEEYFEVYGAAVNKARELGMFLTIYDEYGFPSGSGGANQGDGIPRFKNKYPDATLRRLDKHEEEVTGPGNYTKTLPAGKLMGVVAMNTRTRERVDLTGKVGGGAISWNIPAGLWKIMTFVCVLDGDPNVDYLDPDRVAKYVEMTYQPYFDKYGKDFGGTISGAFYDEPTLYRAQGRVWTDRFNEKFEAAHGFSPSAWYPALWYDIGPETQAARNYLFGFRSELYAAGYMKTVQDWCTAHGGIPLLGHQDQENIKNPVGVSGDLMKCYKYQEVPGVDKIGWENDPEGYYKVISSVVYNWDKTQAMTETYGAMGNLSWDELYAIVMEQYAKGINNIVPHGVWYNLDRVNYLPELSDRNPLYADGLAAYNSYVGRLNVLLQQPGRHVADIAVLYPIATLQAGFHFDGPLGPYSGGVHVPEADYLYLGELLATKVCRDFTFLHPEVLDDRCSVKDGCLTLDNKLNHEQYKVLILPGHKTICWSNLKKIKEFYDHGGKVIATGQLPCKSAEFGHDADVVATIKAMFPKVGEQILPLASSEWRESGAYEAAKAIDGAADTHWRPSPADEEKNRWWVGVDFGVERTFNSTVIKEEVERTTAYSIQYWNGSDWVTCATGTTIGSNKRDTFKAVTASRVRLLISGVSADTPSITELRVHLNDGPDLAHNDRFMVQDGNQGGRAIYLNSPNETNLRQALDQALEVYDVGIAGNQKLRYIHKVLGETEVYFFASLGTAPVSTAVELRGTLTPEIWNPHTGEISTPGYAHEKMGPTDVTKVRVTLPPTGSLFIVARKGSSTP